METTASDGPLPHLNDDITIQDLPPSSMQEGIVFAPDATHQQYIDAAHDAREHLAHGQVAEGWQDLATVGDAYAGAAAHVTGDSTAYFQSLVQANWDRSAGPQAYTQHFQEVAETHLGNYLNHIEQHGGMLPDSSDIEASYLQAVTQHGLPPETAIDLVINDAPLGNTWEHVVGLEGSRISDHDVGAGLGQLEAFSQLGSVGISGTSYWIGDHLLEARNDLHAYGDQVQHAAQEFYEQTGDRLLEIRSDLHEVGDHAQQVFHEWGNPPADGINLSSHEPTGFTGSDWGHPAGPEVPSSDWQSSFGSSPHGPDLFLPHGTTVDDVSHPDAFPSTPSIDFQLPDFADHSGSTASAFSYGDHPDVASQFHQGLDVHAEPSSDSPSIHFDTDYGSMPSVDFSHVDSDISYGDGFHDGGSVDYGTHDSGTHDSGSYDSNSFDSGSFDGSSYDGGSFDDSGGSVDDAGGVD